MQNKYLVTLKESGLPYFQIIVTATSRENVEMFLEERSIGKAISILKT